MRLWGRDAVAIAAMAHPLTIAAAFFVAPVTSLTPVIGAGYVLAFVQAWLRPPKVAEFETVSEDIAGLRGWLGQVTKVFIVEFDVLVGETEAAAL